MTKAKNYLGSSKKENNTSNNNRDKNTTDSASTTGKPLSVWESPEFEEFDLCMEVTAYVHQWK